MGRLTVEKLSGTTRLRHWVGEQHITNHASTDTFNCWFQQFVAYVIVSVTICTFLISSTVCLRPALKPSVAPTPVASVANKSTKAKKPFQHDPYLRAQTKQRKAANVQRRKELEAQRGAGLGDSVRGIPTPLIESFKTVEPVEGLDKSTTTPLNHFLKPEDVKTALEHSYILTQPVVDNGKAVRDPAKEAEELKAHEEAHKRASEAIQRIVSLDQGNSKDRTRANIQRCIDIFGRHNTDESLKPRPRGPGLTIEKTPRAGPDTGSSEVQIAVLTAKINVLADELLLPHRQKDKINKANLRKLVHKRQKLLAYLRRKERGGERWQTVIGSLGLTDATWKGEISL
jgi:ribosomal protein S15